MNVSIRTIQRELDDLKRRKIIMRVGSRKTGKWMVNQNEEKA
jgi:predicted HTH transcriptional regulator